MKTQDNLNTLIQDQLAQFSGSDEDYDSEEEPLVALPPELKPDHNPDAPTMWFGYVVPIAFIEEKGKGLRDPAPEPKGKPLTTTSSEYPFLRHIGRMARAHLFVRAPVDDPVHSLLIAIYHSRETKAYPREIEDSIICALQEELGMEDPPMWRRPFTGRD